MTLAMRRLLSSSLSVWLIISLVGIYFLFHLHQYIHFGIDLVGGTYITLEVHGEKALENELGDRLQTVIAKLKTAQKPLPSSQNVSTDQATMTFATPAEAMEAEQWILNHQSRLKISREQASIQLSLTSEEKQEISRDAITSIINVLRTRLDTFGVGEVSIAAQGDRHIIVELPDVHNPQEAKAMIGKAALLEVKLVADAGRSEEELLQRHNGKIPEGMIIVQGCGRYGKEFYLVPSYTDLTGRLLKDASMDFGGYSGVEPTVKFVFKPEGGEKFYELTSKNYGRRIAIIIDGAVITAPVVQAAISTEGNITGDFSEKEAHELATLLKSGAFVAPVSFEEERHIGPSLGAESIRQGLLACLVGLGLLFLFSLVMYKVAGIFAVIVLMYNLLLILFMLALFGATLTLPGIAGMILTIGMAIDASILIYERIREELIAGSSLRKAVDAGFAGATAVILDANVTHLLVALVLYKLGAGPIQGFAVTMIIGIISTLITGLLLLRTLFNFSIDVLGLQKIKI